MTDEERFDAITDFNDHILHEIEKAIKKAGGDFDSFIIYMQQKECIGEMDGALTLAFDGVDKISWKGCF